VSLELLWTSRSLSREVAIDHVDKIRAALLNGQGKNDPRMAIATSDAMVAALRKTEARSRLRRVVRRRSRLQPARKQAGLLRTRRGIPRQASRGRAEPWKKISGSTAELR